MKGTACASGVTALRTAGFRHTPSKAIGQYPCWPKRLAQRSASRRSCQGRVFRGNAAWLPIEDSHSLPARPKRLDNFGENGTARSQPDPRADTHRRAGSRHVVYSVSRESLLEAKLRIGDLCVRLPH